MKNRWYSISAKAGGNAEISIFDEIGLWGLTAKDFKQEFEAVKDADSIHVSINSPGGGFFDGMAIYQLLSSVREKVDVEVYGIAASIASIIALSGTRLSLARGSYFMIHNPWTFAMGDAEELRKTAEILDKMRDDTATIYANKSGMLLDEALTLMDEETWYTADEALAAGFADEVNDYGEVAARIPDLGRFAFAHTPQALLEKQTKNEIKTERQFERLLREAGFSRTEAEGICARGFKAVQGDPESPTEQGDPARDQKRLPFRTLVEEAEYELSLSGGTHA